MDKENLPANPQTDNIKYITQGKIIHNKRIQIVGCDDELTVYMFLEKLEQYLSVST